MRTNCWRKGQPPAPQARRSRRPPSRPLRTRQRLHLPLPSREERQAMYHLATLFPPVQRIRRLPLSRDQLMLLMAAINEIFLSVDVYLAHSTSGPLKPNEWIPVIFGVTAGVLLLLAG